MTVQADRDGRPVPEVLPSVLSEGSVLVATELWKAYRRGWWPRQRVLQVLKGSELSMAPGEIVGLVGENGSGKSTLMRVLVGDPAADAGTDSGDSRS